MWMLEIKLRPFGGAANAFSHRIISSVPRIISFLNYVYIFVFVCGLSACVWAGAERAQKRASDPLELGLLGPRATTCVLGRKPSTELSLQPHIHS